MLNKDYLSGILSANRNSLSLDFSPMPNKWDAFNEAVTQGITDWDNGQKKQAYINALQTGDQETIDKALANYNPEAYANVMTAREERQQKLDDLQAQRDFQREMLDAQTQRAFALENMRNQNARSLKEWELGLKGQAEQEAEAQSQKQAQDSLNDLYDVASKGNIGAWTDWRVKHKLSGAETEQDLGRLSAAVAGIAPRAIAKLKAAGVSGINTKGEFLQYIGLPEKPTSEQIMGAIPMMAQIAGVENPIPEKSLKQFNNSTNAPMLDVGATQNFNNGFSVTRVK